MFASRSVLVHVTRGLVGLGSLALLLMVGPSIPWLWLALGPLALIAFRGCPMCWTLGLVQTVAARLSNRKRPVACIDGSCARRGS